MDTNNTTPNPSEQPVVKDTVTPETPVAQAPALEPESEIKYEGVLANYKEGINPPVATTATTTTETPIAPTPAAPVAPIAPTAPDYSNPEIAKQKLQEILNTPTGETPTENQVPTGVTAQKPKTSILRILFLIVLIIFLGVIAAVAYYMIKGTGLGGTTAIPTVAPIITEVPKESAQPEVTICTLNDQQYQIGETFAAADGCNVCSCAADLTITCTERVCAPTVAPTQVATSTPTKATTVTPSKAVTPSKTATASPTKKVATPTK